MAGMWMKIDNGIFEHPDFVDLSPEAWCLFFHILGYCSRNLTDGHIGRAAMRRCSPVEDVVKAADELVDAGVVAVTGAGFEVVNYLRHQRSREDVMGQREAARERMTKLRNRRKPAGPDDTDTPPNGTKGDDLQCSKDVRANIDRTRGVRANIERTLTESEPAADSVDVERDVRANFARSSQNVRSTKIEIEIEKEPSVPPVTHEGYPQAVDGRTAVVAASIIAVRRLAASRTPIGNPGAWLAAARQRIAATPEVAALVAEGLTPDEIAGRLEPEPSTTSAPAPTPRPESTQRTDCDVCEGSGWVIPPDTDQAVRCEHPTSPDTRPGRHLRAV